MWAARGTNYDHKIIFPFRLFTNQTNLSKIFTYSAVGFEIWTLQLKSELCLGRVHMYQNSLFLQAYRWRSMKPARCIQTDGRRRNEHNKKTTIMAGQLSIILFAERSGRGAEYFALVTLIGSISSAARSQACSPPLLLLLWDVAGFRGRRLEVEGWGDGVIDTQSMRIHRPHENTRAVFSDFPPLRPGFKTVCLQDPCGRSAEMMQNTGVYTRKRFHVDGP